MLFKIYIGNGNVIFLCSVGSVKAKLGKFLFFISGHNFVSVGYIKKKLFGLFFEYFNSDL